MAKSFISPGRVCSGFIQFSVQLKFGLLALIGRLAHHDQIAPAPANAARLRTFQARKQELLAKSDGGGIRVELVSIARARPIVAYCVSTVSRAGVGEIDSIFIDEDWRGQGVGTELMRRALAWLNKMGAKSKVVSVMCENEKALAFYRRFDFHPRAVLLQESRAGS